MGALKNYRTLSQAPSHPVITPPPPPLFWDTQVLKRFSVFCFFCYWVYPLQLSSLLENLQASRKLTDAETYACTSLTSHCQQV